MMPSLFAITPANASGMEGFAGEHMQTNAPQKLLRIPEACTIAGIGKTMAYELIAANEWPVVRIGKAVRIPRRQLEDWIDRQVAAQNPHFDARRKGN